MRITKFLRLGLLLGAISPAPAWAMNVLTLGPPLTFPELGDTFELALGMDFDDVTLGGQVRIAYDFGVLALLEIRFDGALGDDLDFRCPTDPTATSPVTCPSDSNVLSFGSFAGLVGTRPIAVLVFEVVGAGDVLVSAQVERPFSDEVGEALDVQGASARVTAVPGPPQLLLLLIGLVPLLRGGRPPERDTIRAG